MTKSYRILLLIFMALLFTAQCCNDGSIIMNQSMDTNICFSDSSKPIIIRFSRYENGKIYFFGNEISQEQEFNCDFNNPKPITILTKKYDVTIIALKVYGTNGDESYYIKANVLNIIPVNRTNVNNINVIDNKSDMYVLNEYVINDILSTLIEINNNLDYYNENYDETQKMIQSVQEFLKILKTHQIIEIK